ncbi:MAG TPA: portal protein [Acetobacteraceae bacterium]|nr:portal protein [Acetobacteraceae bacterium]
MTHDTPPELILRRHARALERRRPFEALWQDCHDHVLPRPGAGAALYDATAADAAEGLAASLLAELTPPWSRWFGLRPARLPANEDAARSVTAALEDAAETLQGHLDRSNFALEMHQAFLDLVVTGTGVLLVEEAPAGEASAFRFTALPMREAVLEQGASGLLDTVYRALRMTAAEIAARYPDAMLPRAMLAETALEEAPRHAVIEAVWPARAGFAFAAILADAGEAPLTLAAGEFTENPFIAFRWLKAPGEVFGRGPVAKALPDIRTANKVVELVLKNASIAATGIWQAEDDGVLNPATVQLVPGAIIPKAPGSSGLTPLATPGSFDVSQLVLDDLRRRIRAALLADRIGAQRDVRMTATEVLERGAETARLLGATYGRLQSELLTPLIARCLGILRRRGEIAPVLLDGREAAIRYASPLAQLQGRADAANTLLFLTAVRGLGAEAARQVDAGATARWLARTLGAPAETLLPVPTPDQE